MKSLLPTLESPHTAATKLSSQFNCDIDIDSAHELGYRIDDLITRLPNRQNGVVRYPNLLSKFIAYSLPRRIFNEDVLRGDSAKIMPNGIEFDDPMSEATIWSLIMDAALNFEEANSPTDTNLIATPAIRVTGNGIDQILMSRVASTNSEGVGINSLAKMFRYRGGALLECTETRDLSLERVDANDQFGIEGFVLPKQSPTTDDKEYAKAISDDCSLKLIELLSHTADSFGLALSHRDRVSGRQVVSMRGITTSADLIPFVNDKHTSVIQCIIPTANLSPREVQFLVDKQANAHKLLDQTFTINSL